MPIGQLTQLTNRRHQTVAAAGGHWKVSLVYLGPYCFCYIASITLIFGSFSTISKVQS